MSSVETRTCGGKCENFDPNRIDGEQVGVVKLDDKQGGILEVRRGLCRAPYGLFLGPRTEGVECKHDQFKNIPVSITEAQLEKIPA